MCAFVRPRVPFEYRNKDEFPARLAGPKGDIETLSRLLDLDLDVRMAKDPRQYICDVKVHRLNTLLIDHPGKALREAVYRAEEPVLGMPWEQVAREALPAGANVVGRLDALSIL